MNRGGAQQGAVRYVVVSAGDGEWNVVDTYSRRTAAGPIAGYANATKRADELEAAGHLPDPPKVVRGRIAR